MAISQKINEELDEAKDKIKSELNSYKRGIPLKAIGYVLLGLAVLDIACLFIVEFAIKPSAKHDTFWSDVNKSLLQILVVFVIGSLISIFIKGYDAYRAAEKTLEDFRKSTLLKLHQYYADTKRARRTLRATAFTPPYDHTSPDDDANCIVQKEEYDKQLIELNDIQLSLEILKKDIRMTPTAFTETSRELLIKTVGEMDVYLNDLIEEWESKRGNFSPETKISINELSSLRDFIKPASFSFRENYIERYSNSVEIIMSNILSPPKL